MKKWPIVLLLGIFLFPVYSGASGDPPTVQKKVVKIPDDKMERGGWLGVTITDVTNETAKEKNLRTDEGAFVSSVAEKSPADSAGIHKGDIIVECNGKKIADSGDLREYIGDTSPGSKVSIVVIRSGEKKTLTAVLGTAKEMKKHITMTRPMPMKHCISFAQKPRLGMNLEELNEQLGEYFGAPNGEGVLVREVYKKSLAEKSGFKAGDVITRAGKKSVDEVSDIQKIVQSTEPGETLTFEVIRKGSKKSIPVVIEKNEDEDSHGCDFPMPCLPEWKSDDEFLEIPDADIDIHIDKENFRGLRDDMNRLKDELGKMKLEKKIRVLVSPRDL
jgi:membrane-associated protease RseP (regulator of RpoE activity)